MGHHFIGIGFMVPHKKAPRRRAVLQSDLARASDKKTSRFLAPLFRAITIFSLP